MVGSHYGIPHSTAVDYTSQRRVVITYITGNIQDRLMYERPQPQLPAGPLSTFDRVCIS